MTKKDVEKKWAWFHQIHVNDFWWRLKGLKCSLEHLWCLWHLPPFWKPPKYWPRICHLEKIRGFQEVGSGSSGWFQSWCAQKSSALCDLLPSVEIKIMTTHYHLSLNIKFCCWMNNWKSDDRRNHGWIVNFTSYQIKHNLQQNINKNWKKKTCVCTNKLFCKLPQERFSLFC